MRLFIASLMFCLPGVAYADAHLGLSEGVAHGEDAHTFRLGGAATRAAISPTSAPEEAETPRTPRLSLPMNFVRGETLRTEGPLGLGTFFVSEGYEAGQEAVEVGTYLSRGQARAGLSVTYRELDPDLARSELFLDYAITDRFSIGLSGVFDNELDDDEAVRQLGINAEFSTSGGAFVQGGVAGASDYDPIIGLSVGLRF